MATNRDAGPRPRPLTLVVIAIVAIVPVALLRQTLHPIDDPDAFWHILSGQNVWRTHDVVVNDPYGWFSTNMWVQIDWLSDLAMAWAHHAGGYPAVVWLYATLGVVLFLALYVACRSSAPPVIAAIAAVVGWVGTYGSQGFRPQTVSFILLVVTLLVWQRVRQDPQRTPWGLIPLTYVWACLHGLWVLGPLVGLAVVAGMALDRDRSRRDLVTLAAVPVASLAVAAATPIGPRLLASPFTVSSYAGLVSEWRPPDIHEPYVAATIALLAVIAVGWARSTSRASSPDVLLWLMAVGWALLYSRTVAVGAVIAAPLAARALSEMLPVPPDPAARRVERIAVPLGGVIAVIVAGLLASSQTSSTRGMPPGLSDGLDRLPHDTVVLNDDALGGWLLLEHPELHPVIDTRTYLFDVPHIESYLKARSALGSWESFLQTTGATAALLREGEPLVPLLTERLGWTVSSRGDGFVLLVAPGAAA